MIVVPIIKLTPPSGKFYTGVWQQWHKNKKDEKTIAELMRFEMYPEHIFLTVLHSYGQYEAHLRPPRRKGAPWKGTYGFSLRSGIKENSENADEGKIWGTLQGNYFTGKFGNKWNEFSAKLVRGGLAHSPSRSSISV
jgi:hypothetical protein